MSFYLPFILSPSDQINCLYAQPIVSLLFSVLLIFYISPKDWTLIKIWRCALNPYGDMLRITKIQINLLFIYLYNNIIPLPVYNTVYLPAQRDNETHSTKIRASHPILSYGNKQTYL